MEYIEVSARTVDDAITEALIKLGATSDQIEYEVIEKGSTGFLGIARKDAVIKVRKKYSVEGDITEFLFTARFARYCRESRVCPLLPMRIPMSSPFSSTL